MASSEEFERLWNLIGKDVHHFIFQLLFQIRQKPMTVEEITPQFRMEEKLWASTRLVCKYWRFLSDSNFDFIAHSALLRSSRRNCTHSMSLLLSLSLPFPSDEIVSEMEQCLIFRRQKMLQTILENATLSTHVKQHYQVKVKEAKLGKRKFKTAALRLFILSLPFDPLIVASSIILKNYYNVVCERPIQTLIKVGIAMEGFGILLLIMGYIAHMYKMTKENFFRLFVSILFFFYPVGLVVWGFIGVSYYNDDICRAKAKPLIDICLVTSIFCLGMSPLLWRTWWVLGRAVPVKPPDNWVWIGDTITRQPQNPSKTEANPIPPI